LSQSGVVVPTVDVSECMLCGGAVYTPVLEEPPYSVRRCSSCTLAWVSPRLTAQGLRELYGDGYWRSDSPRTIGYGDYRQDEDLYLRTFERRMKFVLRHVPPGGRALDVGAAAGYFVRVAQNHGFDAVGVELSAEIAQHGRDRWGLDIHVGTLDSAPFESQSFDLITMWDVVEHIPDPVALLRKARQLVKPSGALVVETQNIDSRFARLLGRRWQHYKHAEHLYHFNPDTIDALLARAGFRIDHLTARFGGKYVSFDFVAERAGRLHPAVTRLLTKLGEGRRWNAYVNVFDEMVLLARPLA
jgi:SAM-dependent methyltransferase